MDEKELRIRAITRMYYSNPKVQEAILKFSRNREVVPRYYEGFGKRPDSLQYVSDILGLVNKGATSFHSSEEIWTDPLKINSEMSRREMDEIRKGWDLLIDIDSPFLDCSKIATKLIIAALEQHGVKNYGINPEKITVVYNGIEEPVKKNFPPATIGPWKCTSSARATPAANVAADPKIFISGAYFLSPIKARIMAENNDMPNRMRSISLPPSTLPSAPHQGCQRRYVSERRICRI